MKTIRKSHAEINKIYFFTATIHQWKWLLYPPPWFVAHETMAVKSINIISKFSNENYFFSEQRLPAFASVSGGRCVPIRV